MATKNEIVEAIWTSILQSMFEEMQYVREDVKEETGCTERQAMKYSEEVMTKLHKLAGY